MAGSQISTSVSIIDSLSGFMALSLTEYNTSAAAAIAAGSKVEIAGAFFQFSADETPTGWAAIVTATTAYIALTASGTAGSQVVNASYTSTAPTWRDDLQGWYASAASSVRIVASVYKAESASYYPKSVLAPYQSTKILDNIYISGIASLASSLSVAGVASMASSLSVSGKSYFSKGSSISGSMGGAPVTLGSVYSSLSTVIPTTSDTIIVSGGVTGYPISHAARTDSTTIRIFYNHASGNSTIDAVSGSATTVASIYVVW